MEAAEGPCSQAFSSSFSEEGSITGKKGVSFVAHPVSRQILWVEGARVDSKGPEEEPAADEEKNSDKKSSVNLSPSGSSTTGGRSSPNR